MQGWYNTFNLWALLTPVLKPDPCNQFAGFGKTNEVGIFSNFRVTSLREC